GVDDDGIAGMHAGCAANVEGGIACSRGNRKAGVREAKQVEAMRCEPGSRRNLDRGEDGLLRWVFGHRPAREVDVAGAAVVELDEGLRGVGAELVDPDRED